MDACITPAALQSLLTGTHPPLLIDVRRDAAFLAAPDMLLGALRRDPPSVAHWADELPLAAAIAVYCVHGHEVSQNAARTLRDRGLNASYIEGGIEAMRAAGNPLLRKPAGTATRWITRERPKVDRIACPWLISRLLDRDAEFLYVPTAEVRKIAAEKDAIPYDVSEVMFSHDSARCSFDAFIRIFRLTDPALLLLADIVRGADTGHPEIAPQSAGLVALSLGLSRLIANDHDQLRQGMVMYDALYLWCKEGQDEKHTWNPEAYR